jgi:cell fate (sporulation/competence/biofilm development) regulator YlbF (YheA/YmcA/DUF963 family)
MGRVEELKEELKQAVIDSGEYQEYRRLNDELSRNLDLKRAVDEFRRRNFEIQCNDDDQNISDNLAQIEDWYAGVSNESLVKNYLTAEMRLCRMVQDVCVSLVDVIDFNVDFLR